MDFFDSVAYWLSQAYVYIPSILAMISAIGFPSIVQIAKIFSSAKLYLTQVKILLQKVNECVTQITNICDLVIAWTDNDIAFQEQLAKTTINKKQKVVIENQINALKERRKLIGGWTVKKLEKSELETKKSKVKIKVKRGH